MVPECDQRHSEAAATLCSVIRPELERPSSIVSSPRRGLASTLAFSLFEFVCVLTPTTGRIKSIYSGNTLFSVANTFCSLLFISASCLWALKLERL